MTLATARTTRCCGSASECTCSAVTFCSKRRCQVDECFFFGIMTSLSRRHTICRPSPSGDKVPAEDAAAADSQQGNRTSGGGLAATKDDNSASESSGFGSLTKKRGTGTQQQDPAVVGLGIVDGGNPGLTETHLGDTLIESMTATVSDTIQSGVSNQMLPTVDHGHSRNSSNTSQVGEGGDCEAIAHNLIESPDLSDEQRVGLQQYFAESALAPKLRRRLQPHTVRGKGSAVGRSSIYTLRGGKKEEGT